MARLTDWSGRISNSNHKMIRQSEATNSNNNNKNTREQRMNIRFFMADDHRMNVSIQLIWGYDYLAWFTNAETIHRTDVPKLTRCCVGQSPSNLPVAFTISVFRLRSPKLCPRRVSCYFLGWTS
eukprot:GFUD01049894.1.p1 GENE.GFUD01049894.1~~GFUD01049894.1.p1  ORF type:complete len:124 (-),score=14.80 GFUD01049894.1:9-380(-)